MEKGFWDRFRENMEALGLPAPQSLFGNVGLASATIAAIAKVVQTYGTKVTVSEAILTMSGGAAGAGGGAVGVAAATSEVVLIAGGLTAAFYVGACIGSLAVALGETLSGGITLSDCLASAIDQGIPPQPWLVAVLKENPKFLGATNYPLGVRDVRVV